MVIMLMQNQIEFDHNNYVNNLISVVFMKCRLDISKKETKLIKLINKKCQILTVFGKRNY